MPRWVREDGFSAAEMTAVIGIIAILSVMVPMFVGQLQASTALEAARELRTALLRAKTLAVTTRNSVCLQRTGGGYQIRQGGCAGAAMTFPDANAGTFQLTNHATVSAGPSPVFTPFGTVTGTGAFTVTTPNGKTATVTVQASGRITIP